MSIIDKIPPRLAPSSPRMRSTCMEKYGPQHKFIGFLDSDEYVVLTGKFAKDTLDSFLLRFGDVSGVALNWYFVGSSQPIHRPDGLVGCNYIDCAPNHHVKSFCNTKHTVGQRTMHECRFHSNLKVAGRKPHTVSVTGRKVSGPFNYHFTKKSKRNAYDAVIYHYVVKSLDDYARKNARGSGAGRHKTFQFFLHMVAQQAKGVGRCQAVRNAMLSRGMCAGSPGPGNFKLASAEAIERVKNAVVPYLASTSRPPSPPSAGAAAHNLTDASAVPSPGPDLRARAYSQFVALTTPRSDSMIIGAPPPASPDPTIASSSPCPPGPSPPGTSPSLRAEDDIDLDDSNVYSAS